MVLVTEVEATVTCGRVKREGEGLVFVLFLNVDNIYVDMCVSNIFTNQAPWRRRDALLHGESAHIFWFHHFEARQPKDVDLYDRNIRK